jgi:DNA polymerase III sliding clamp (beta) subunit (PCNA family)
MQFTISTDELRATLLGLDQFGGTRHTPSVFSNVYIEATPDGVRFATRYVTQCAIARRLPDTTVTVDQTGAGLFDHSTLYRVAADLKDMMDYVTFTLDGDAIVLTQDDDHRSFSFEHVPSPHDQSSDSIETWSPEYLDHYEEQQAYSVPNLERVFGEIQPYISTDDAREALTRAHVQDGYIEATDGYRALRRDFPDLGEEVFFPRKLVDAAEYIARVRADDYADCSVRYDEDGVRVDIDTWMIQCGTDTDSLSFPDIYSVLPDDDPKTAGYLAVEDVQNAHSSLAVCTDDVLPEMSLDIQQDTVALKAEGNGGMVTAEVPASIEHEGRETLLVNYQLMEETIQTFEATGELHIRTHGTSGPILIDGNQGERLAILMPRNPNN